MGRITLNGMYEYDPTIFEGMVLPEDYDRDALLYEILQRSGQLYPYHQQPAVLKTTIRLWFARNFLNFDRTMAALLAEYNPIENYDRHEDSTRTPDLTDTDTKTGKDTIEHKGRDQIEHVGIDKVVNSGKDTTKHMGHDKTEHRGHDITTHDYTDTDHPYKETMQMEGPHTTEEQVAAYDSGYYQPSKKTIETFGASNDDRKDVRSISGLYDDDLEHGHDEDLIYGKTEELDHGLTETTTRGTTDNTIFGSSEDNIFGSTLTGRHTGTEDFTSHIHGNIGVKSNQSMVLEEIELRKFDVYVDIAMRFEHEFLVQVY